MNKYLRYVLKQPSGEIAVDVDFSGEVSVKHDYIKQMLFDMQSFTGVTTGRGWLSELYVEIESQPYTVISDHHTGKVNVKPALPDTLKPVFSNWQNPYILASQSLGVDLQPQIRKIMEAEAKQTVNDPQQREQLLVQIKAAAGGQGEKILELTEKMNALEAELGKQKKMDEQVLSLGELETELGTVDSQIASVQTMIQKQTEINSALVKYGAMAQADLEAEADKLHKQLAQLRHDELLWSVQSQKQGFGVTPRSDSEPKAPKQANYLLGLGGVLVLISLGIYLITANAASLIVGVAGGLTVAGIYLVLNWIPAEIQIGFEAGQGSANLASKGDLNPANQNDGPLRKIEKFFVDKAWINVLKSESKAMSEMISTKLNGSDIRELQTAQANLRQNILNLKAKIEEYKQSEIPPQEYLQKRRELDMLNIDKSRLERDLRDLPDMADLQEKLMQLQSLDDSQGAVWQLPEKLAQILGFKSILLTESGVIQREGGGELSTEETFQTITWWRLTSWEQDKTYPAVVVDLLTGVSEQAKVLWNEQILHWRSTGQIVLVTSLP